MKRINKIDATAARLGFAMREARHVCHIPHDDAAELLHIMPNDLHEYERGVTEVPIDILQRVFILGYKMMQVRIINRRYRLQRKMLSQIKNAVENK